MCKDYKNSAKLGVIGFGKMSGAILEGVLKNKFLSNNNIYIFDVNETSKNLAQKKGFNVLNSIDELLNKVDTILIATKPFVVNDVLNELKNNYKNQLVISILAGVKIEKYHSILPDIKIVRVMPNIAALLANAMSAICPSTNCSQDDITFAVEFMKNCGEVIIEEESKMDIVTALSGSGPAFYYKIIELMASSAHKAGLDFKKAMLLSAQTALGSAKMVLEYNFDTDTLIKNVTTPGGCTEVGNNVLNNSDISDIFDKTIKDTIQKAHDLG